MPKFCPYDQAKGIAPGSRLASGRGKLQWRRGMNQVRKLTKAPDHQRLASEIAPFDYCDAYAVTLPGDRAIGDIAQKIFALPRWVNALMEIRRLLIVKTFGLKTGKDPEAQARQSAPCASWA
jgi:hypothetical protein